MLNRLICESGAKVAASLKIITFALLSLLSFWSFTAQANENHEELEPVSLQLKWLYQFQFAGYIAAIEKGFYAEEGLDVTLREKSHGMDVVDEVMDGEADYGVGGIGLLARYSNGSDLKALAAIFQHDATALISLADSNIVSPYEMKGKRVMLDPTSGNDAAFRMLLNEANIELNDINILPQEWGIEPLLKGRADVIAIYVTDQPYQLKQLHVPYNLIEPRNYGYDFYGDILFTSGKELRQHPGRSQRMLKASLKGWQYALDHTEEIIQLIKNKYGYEGSISQLRFEARQTKKLISDEVIPLGTIDVGRLKRVSETYHQLKISPKLSQSELQRFIHQPILSLNLTIEEQQWLAENPVITLGVDKNFAPYEWIDEKGNYVGIAAEYIHLLEERLGIKFNIVSDPSWEQLISLVKSGEIDMLACLNKTDDRESYLSFTPPYVTNPVVIVNTAIDNYIGSLSNLKGKTVAIEKGNFSNTLLSDVYPDIHFLYTETPKQALEKVSRGEADAYIGDAAFANYQIKHHDLLNLQFSGQTKAQSAYRMGISKHQPELFNIVNKVFQKVSEDERKDIVEQWIGIEVNNGLSTKTIIKLVASALLIATFLGYWILYLRKSRRAVMSSEKKLNDVLNTSPVPMAIVSGEDTATYINEAFTKVFGFELAEVHGLNDWLLKVLPNATKRQRFIEQIAHALEQQTDTSSPPSSFEAAMLCKDGKYRTIICNAKKLDTHATAETLLIFYDISERKRAEEKLKLSGRVFNQAHEGILITDGSGMIVDVNPAFSEITGYSREQALYQNPSILKSDRHEPDFYSEMWTALRVEGHWQGEIWNRRQNGDTYAQLLTISTLDDENGETTHYLGLFSDITESKQQQQALEMMAHYDVLTQLPNRTLFADRFKQAIAHSHRNNTLLAVVFLDLDGFKPVNDQYGHDVGDQLLIEVSKRISTCVREDDTVSRLGGDEFAMLLNDISSSEHCENLINRIRHAIELPYEINGESILISASLGVTLYPEDNSDADTLLRHADQAMYKAKQSGRQRHQLFDTQEDQQYNEKQSQFKSIQDALKADELVLFYQPKLNMRTGQVIGAEALIRWQHPEQGLLMPIQFLPTIENSDLEIELGNWVINQVIKQVSIWKNQGIELEVSINISSHHILWPGFYEYLELVLSRYENTSPQLIQLEILESSVLTDIQNISSIISQCRQSLGLKISLDDFGTGYSSLTHLRHFPVDIIKIDRSFIRDIIDDSYDYTIVDGVIGLTDAFHHQVIAEGVETTQQGLMLLAMGCELAQGYAIAKPMSVTDFHEWLGTYQADSDWLDFASRHMSAEQTLAELMTLQITHWHARVINNLRSTPDSIQQWPSMDLKKCHFEHWLQQAKKQNLFDNEWLQSMNIAYTELYHEANALKYQFQQQQLENNEVGISELTKRYETIIDLLANRD